MSDALAMADRDAIAAAAMPARYGVAGFRARLLGVVVGAHGVGARCG